MTARPPAADNRQTARGGAPAAPSPLRLESLAASLVVADAAGSRLDVFLADRLPIFASRKAAYKAVKEGRASINGQPTIAPHQRLAVGDRIDLADDRRPPPPPLALELTVVFEDDWLAVVVKPPGLAVSGNFARTAVRALPTNLLPSHAPDALRTPLPVHRLDAPTGGLLLVAKRATALVDLGRQFARREVRKRYRAIAAGHLPPVAQVELPVDGRPASTRFHRLASVPSLNYGVLTVVDCFPESGRTHQIRRHLAALGAPIVGDPEYGTPGQVLKGKGLFLWAVELAFRHPDSGAQMQFAVDPPAKFASLLAREQRRTLRQRGNAAIAPG